MDHTTIVQDTSEVYTSATTTEYRIETTVTVAGELPTEMIFVYTIVDTADPAADTFTRVASVGDLDGDAAVPIGRDVAIAAGGTRYLASFCAVQYADLTVATQAKVALTNRINDLINSWVVYRDDFMANDGVDQFFPTNAPDLVQARVDTYTTAKAARVQAEVVLVTTDTDLQLAQADAAAAQSVYAIYLNEVVFCQDTRVSAWLVLNSSLSALFGAETVISSTSKTDFCTLAGLEISGAVTWPPTAGQLTTLDTHDAAWRNWYNAIVAFDNARNTFTTLGAPERATVDTNFQTFCQNAAAQAAAAYNNKTAKDTLVADAVTTKKEAEASLASAQAAEDAALAAVYAVCPTYNPNA